MLRWKKEGVSTPLHAAAEQGRTDVTGVLLSAGAHVNAKGDDGDTPLHVAAYHEHADVVKLLRAAGAKE